MFDKKVLIAIPIFKGKEYLPDLLSSLDEITYPKDLYKVVIWDDNSPDDTFEVLQKMIVDLKYPSQILTKRALANGGFCVNSNRGLRQAVEENYDYVYLLNQDVGVDKDFVQPLVEALENDQTIQTAQSKILYFSDHSKINSRGNYYHYLGFGYAGGNLETDNLTDEIREITYPSGAGVMIRVGWLRKIGFLEEYLWMYHEDVYLGLLTWYAGGRNVLVPKSEIYHKYTFNSSMSRLDFMERNRWLTMLWFYRWPTLILIFPAFLGMELGQWLYAMMRGWSGKKWKSVKFFFSLKNWREILTIRKRIQSLRKCSDRQVLYHRAVAIIDHQEINNPILKYLANPCFAAYWWLVKNLFLWW